MTGPALADFESGARYDVQAEVATVPLTLDKAEALPRSTRPEGGFRLEFVGPAEPVLPQAIYAFHRDGEAVDIFIVPVGHDGDGVRYEAVFY